jgi:V-type H+-transporting ATPase subunit a
MAIGVMSRIEDLKTVLGQTQDHRHRVLVAAAKNVRMWFTKARKIKAIYHTLNLFNLDVTQKCLIAECWCPTGDLDKIQMALKRATVSVVSVTIGVHVRGVQEESGSSVPNILNRMDSKQAPPTYHRASKVMRGFQTIVDSYGVATYREINPGRFRMSSYKVKRGHLSSIA